MTTLYQSYKNTLQRISRPGAMLLAAGMILASAGCTKNFEKYNTDPTGITDENLELPTLFPPLQSAIFRNYQTAQNLSADGFAGYMMSPTPFKSAYDLNYTLVDDWDKNGFDDQYNYVMAPILRMEQRKLQETNPDFWAIALIVKVEAMHRVTDKFGPIAYSKVGTSAISGAYDSQQAVYNQFFSELDVAVAALKSFIAANPGSTPFAAYDRIYAGDYTKWLKFANSLRLRLALHIVKADPATAKLQGEKALDASNGGLLAAVADNAAIIVAPGSTNDYYQLTKDYDDARMSGSFLSYLTGYGDPRLPILVSPATDTKFPGQYIGIRIGSTLPSKQAYQTYAAMNTDLTFLKDTPQQIMTAAEVWFLKAEAALRGWSGAGTAQANYETGVTISMQQWHVDGTAYLADATKVPAAYVDPKNAANNSAALSTVTVKWEEGVTNERKLERIITQKWIAMFPEGQEAWTEYRRTGYPKLFPVVNNTSNGEIDTEVQIRRLAYPAREYSSNRDEVTKGVQLLGGKDNGGTRVWWDIAKSNF